MLGLRAKTDRLDMIDPDNPRIVTKCLLWEMTADRDQQAVR
jgi:hypothetical protein